jgi:ubiquinone/menaquinone biosynthesis C-methylase UbiE
MSINILKITTVLFLILTLNNTQAQTKKVDSLTNKKLDIVLSFLNLKADDIIADVGTGSGYSLVPIAGAHPNLKFTVQDIDRSTLTEKKLQSQINRNNNKANMLQFNIVYGNDTSTNLPSQTFTKVLLFDVLHEVHDKQRILADIKRILKKDGKLIIEEILVFKPQRKERNCNYPFFIEADFKQLMEANIFVLIKEQVSFENGKKKYIKLFEYEIKE